MRKRVKKPVCPNCGHQLHEADNFCPECGQENHTHQLPLRHFAFELIESLFHFDTKLLNTVKDLLLKPGALTKNYNENKRARYMPPFRFYLFTSAIYFLIIASFEAPNVKLIEAAKNEKTTGGLNFTISKYSDQEQEELRVLSRKEDLSWNDINTFLANHGKEANWRNRINARLTAQGFKGTGKEDIGHKVLKNISYVMFLLMPLFGWLLYLFYRNKKPFYSAQLVFSIHFHTLAFIFLLVVLLGKILVNIDVSGIALIVIAIYLFLSLKNVYEESWLKTLLKGTLLSACYIVVFFVSLFSAMIWSLF